MSDSVNGGDPVVDSAQSGTTDTNGVQQDTEAEKSFTAAEVNEIVQKRLKQEQKKFGKLLEEATTNSTQKKSSNVEDEYKSKLSAYEQQTKALNERLNKMANAKARATVEKELSDAGCNDSELLAEHFISRGLVKTDEDGEIVVDNLNNSLRDLVTEELRKRPHLQKPKGNSGAGTRPPGTSPTQSQSFGDMTPDEWTAWKEQQVPKKSLFGVKK